MSMVLAWVYHKMLDFNKIAKLKGPHTCTIVLIQKNYHQDVAKFVTSTVLPLVSANISMIIMSIQGKKIHYKSQEKSFEVLPELLLALQESSLGTIIQQGHNEDFDSKTTIFKRVF